MKMNINQLLDLNEAELNRAVSQIGNTSLQLVYFLVKGEPRAVYLKLEGDNPGGSTKDRVGVTLVKDLEARGQLKPGCILIESTSGNLGVSLSFIARARGYEFVAVVDPKTTPENLAKMERFGARIEVVKQMDATGGYLLSRLARVKELCASDSRYVWTNQYNNLANPQTHYTTTGPEIYRQMNGRLDAVVIAASTGGTLAGIGRYFREVSPATRIIGVDARGSIVFGGTSAPRKLTGIGSSRPSHFISSSLYDTAILVSDEEAFAFCHALKDATGIKVGGSSGAVLAACGQYLALHPELQRVVCVCPDRGKNYDSSIFNNNWLKEHNLDISSERIQPVTEICNTRYQAYQRNGRYLVRY